MTNDMNVAPVPHQTRPAAVAGRFYPGQAESLRCEVAHHLGSASVRSAGLPKAVIAPHAGYPYSGPIAGSAFSGYTSQPDHPRRVVLLGPAHYVGFSGLAVPSAEAFALPTAAVEVDREAIDQLVRVGLAEINDTAHRPEHALEVELPFLQAVLGDFGIVPILVGSATGPQVAEAIEQLWGGAETTIVVSSDLSHYLAYDAAREVDGETCEAIEAFEPEPIDARHACGCLPIQGLLQVAKRKGLEVTTLDLRNSGDTAGTRDQVVGYGAWAFA